jgi:hypothetical protein
MARPWPMVRKGRWLERKIRDLMPVILLAAGAQGVESAETSLPENVSCTLYRMSGQAELFEIWFSDFTGPCIEGT